MKLPIAATLLLLAGAGPAQTDPADLKDLDYDQARWHPLHLRPAIETATDEQCLACHQEVLERRVRERSQAGLGSADALAWYQTLDTYQGEQETFHRRHLVTDYAREVMDLRCNFCHRGSDPREESAGSAADSDPHLVQRKQVDPDICLLCHGAFAYDIMVAGADRRAFDDAFAADCLRCHEDVRTVRHRVNYLDADAIERFGDDESHSCYGCHGGRAWFNIIYPYPRNPWPDMPEETPDWARDRPTSSDPRYLLGMDPPQPVVPASE
jgi:hypothetical protein